jgi:Na+/H+ antiporter NhaA
LIDRLSRVRRNLGPDKTSAALLLAGTVLALLWANLATGAYEVFWAAPFEITVGSAHLELTLAHLVNDGLMAFFFFVVGLEVKRDLVVGELVDRSRAIVPALAAVAGLLLPALIFLGLNYGGPAQHAWGTVISTDTAFLLGALAIIAPKHPARLRTFLLTLAVVDDIGALGAIAVFYTDDLHVVPLIVAFVALGGIFFARRLPIGRGLAYGILSLVVWLGFDEAGIHATLAGVAVALLLPVFPPKRKKVERALALATSFRQSPNPMYAAAATRGLRDSISINERLHESYAPFTSFVVLPIFALANAGVVLDAATLGAAARSRLTWGIVAGLVIGKLLGITLATAAAQRSGLGRLAPGLTIGRVTGGAALSGIGFTISLLIVDIAIDDPGLRQEARIGVLAASVFAFVLGWAILTTLDRVRPVAAVGASLLRPVDPSRDHVKGRADAPLVLVEYGDFQCPFCSRATGTVDEVRAYFGDDLAWIWRHLPKVAEHPEAELAARAAEAADAQGRFLEFGRRMFDQQDQLETGDLLQIAEDLGLDLDRFTEDLGSEKVARRVTDDADDADLMDLLVTPTFFVNGKRHVGPYDTAALIRALDAARSRPASDPLAS